MSARLVIELRKAVVSALTGPLSTETGTPFEVASALVAIAADFATVCKVDAVHLLLTFVVDLEPNEGRGMARMSRVYGDARMVNADRAIQAARDVCAVAGRRGAT